MQYYQSALRNALHRLLPHGFLGWVRRIFQASSTPTPVIHQQWLLPLAWVGRSVTATTITPTGVVAGPVVQVAGGTLALDVVPGRPVVLRVH
jgi:hypothetical protein